MPTVIRFQNLFLNGDNDQFVPACMIYTQYLALLTPSMWLYQNYYYYIIIIMDGYIFYKKQQ